MRAGHAIIAIAFVAVAAGCVADDPGVVSLPGATVAEGYDLEFVLDGFDRPTQMAFGPSGELVVAELAGEENAGSGRVVSLDLNEPAQRTELQTGLLKPTGVAVVGQTLWIMEQQTLSFASLDPGAGRTVFLDELPFNGRSEGSLTPTDDGGLIFNTSGRKRGAEVADGSGTIFGIKSADPIGSGLDVGETSVIAQGLKHGYAHAFDQDGQLWATEMTDGTFDGDPAEDELLAVDIGDNFDWPACVGDNRPVVEFGGTQTRCDLAPRSHALFEPRATPTAVEVAPWDPDVLLVALWVPDQIVEVPRSAPDRDQPWQPSVVATGLGNPQDLLVDGDRLLVVDHTGGRILALTHN